MPGRSKSYLSHSDNPEGWSFSAGDGVGLFRPKLVQIPQQRLKLNLVIPDAR